MIRNLILFVVIGGVLAGGFYYFFNKNTPEEANITSTVGTLGVLGAGSTQPASQPLGSVSGIKLDTSIFTNPSFLSLRDSSKVLIPRGTEGRPNPFAPIGVDNAPTAFDTLNSLESTNPNTTDEKSSLDNAVKTP